jgi:hypothetical protein
MPEADYSLLKPWTHPSHRHGTFFKIILTMFEQVMYNPDVLGSYSFYI